MGKTGRDCKLVDNGLAERIIALINEECRAQPSIFQYLTGIVPDVFRGRRRRWNEVCGHENEQAISREKAGMSYQIDKYAIACLAATRLAFPTAFCHYFNRDSR